MQATYFAQCAVLLILTQEQERNRCLQWSKIQSFVILCYHTPNQRSLVTERIILQSNRYSLHLLCHLVLTACTYWLGKGERHIIGQLEDVEDHLEEREAR